VERGIKEAAVKVKEKAIKIKNAAVKAAKALAAKVEKAAKVVKAALMKAFNAMKAAYNKVKNAVKGFAQIAKMLAKGLRKLFSFCGAKFKAKMGVSHPPRVSLRAQLLLMQRRTNLGLTIDFGSIARTIGHFFKGVWKAIKRLFGAKEELGETVSLGKGKCNFPLPPLHKVGGQNMNGLPSRIPDAKYLKCMKGGKNKKSKWTDKKADPKAKPKVNKKALKAKCDREAKARAKAKGDKWEKKHYRGGRQAGPARV